MKLPEMDRMDAGVKPKGVNVGVERIQKVTP
jgi:hypothetical protein